MASDSRDVIPDGINMAQTAVKLAPSSRRKAGGQKGQIDMKHRRWIDQVLAESLDRSVLLPWTRSSDKDPVGPARKIPQDAD